MLTCYNTHFQLLAVIFNAVYSSPPGHVTHIKLGFWACQVNVDAHPLYAVWLVLPPQAALHFPL
jgi:hypothetical protein